MKIPTIEQLYNAIIADIETELNITVSLFGRSFLRARAMVQAGRLWLLYLLIAKVDKNIFVDTCDEATLSRFGQVKLNRDRFAATQAKYTATVTGTIGAVIPEGTVFKSNDDALSPGKLFILDSSFTLDGINVITIRALESGTESQLNIGNELTLTAPIALVDSIITVLTETIQPQEAETIESYRQKIILAFRLEPQGGSGADYRLWSLEVQGIINAYPFATSAATNEINLYLESDEPDGVPTAQDLLDVESAIEDPTVDRPSRKPITVNVNYLPVTPLDIDIVITDFIDLTTDKETLIYNAIESLLSDIRPFVGSIDVLADKNDYLSVNALISTILTAVPSCIFDYITLYINGVSYTSYTFENGDIPLLNSVTYDY